MIHVLCSSFLYILSQLDWGGAFWCLLISIVPLILYRRRTLLTFVQGFCWGLIVFMFHLSWLLVTFWRHGAGFFGAMIWLFTVVWFAIICGVWFWGARYSFLCSTIVFFFFVTQLSLVPFARLEGYPLMHPILPWMNFFYKEPIEKSNQIVFIQPWWYGNSNPMFVGYRMIDAICASVRNNLHVGTIIMPESTFCFDLHEYDDFIPIWSDGCEHVNIIFGTHRKSQDGYLNSVVMLRDGKIVQIYDKQHFMPFVEATLWGIDLFHRNHQKVHIEYENDIVTLGTQKYQIFLCSELFFQAKQVKGLPILMLWNDAWLEFGWVKNLALKYIQYFSWKHNVVVWHASTLGVTNIKIKK